MLEYMLPRRVSHFNIVSPSHHPSLASRNSRSSYSTSPWPPGPFRRVTYPNLPVKPIPPRAYKRGPPSTPPGMSEQHQPVGSPLQPLPSSRPDSPVLLYKKHTTLPCLFCTHGPNSYQWVAKPSIDQLRDELTLAPNSRATQRSGKSETHQ